MGTRPLEESRAQVISYQLAALGQEQACHLRIFGLLLVRLTFHRISQLRSRISRVRFGWLCAALSGSFLSVSFLDTLHGETVEKHIVDAVNTVNLDERKQERSLRDGVRNVMKWGMKASELFACFKSSRLTIT